ncbi:large ribosomal subunit protein mL50 [Prorops nasuta]|uniref:large ribosomal subunit protein mL50 n=1 Tax=Prorops nasuta TaxID=863751 RepID=UPI0034CEC8A2
MGNNKRGYTAACWRGLHQLRQLGNKMAALIRHGTLAKAFQATTNLLFVNSRQRIDCRLKSKKPKKPIVLNKYEYDHNSIASRGFLRNYKPYTPSSDVCEQIDEICQKENIPSESGKILDDPILRFKLFKACSEVFKHSIPNSQLCYIETIDDLKKFYRTPVISSTPFDGLVNSDLPPNLHIQSEYLRFHPDTDTLFKGKTAFPRSSTIVTGLKYKKKYPGHKQDDPYYIEPNIMQ